MPKLETNLVQGHVGKQLIQFALPFLLSNFIQTLYSVADMIIVGQFSGTASMSGVNIGSQVTLLITNLVLGLSVGGTVLIAQYLGAGKRQEIKETIGTLFTTLGVLAVVMTAVMLVLKVPLLKLIQTPQESFSEANSYFAITMIGTVFIFGYNALSAVMRGMGDSRNPLIFVAIACGINVIGDLILVAGFKMGAAGAAIATVISQAISMFLCVIYLKKNDFIFDFKLKSFGFHPDRMKMILKIGIPTSVQNTLVSFSFLFLTALVNTLGVTASAAVGAVAKLNGFAILPAIAMSSSISAMSAQNIGAGEIGRAKKTMGIGMLISMSISVVIFVLVQLFPEAFLVLFDNDPEMIASGVQYLRSFSFDYLLVPFQFSFMGLFIGSGHTGFSLFCAAVASLLARIPASYILGITLGYGLLGMGAGGPVATTVGAIISLIYYLTGKWKKMTIIKIPAKEAS
ncbi:MAG TPA: MATE family efflux transporter [Oscillospiraceae bacterium]|nr:MATE family efflux transporter [Oscillospiraceae bacterium]HPF56555.1 MATE family efflux transporter [Clostridiales bacterium]HPK36368.1 MATE family efflux transporter [Oscillospiraceae bacterium]HPR76487.1 MATE family efflux transporter [Oscillospiraceae bacterium]